MAVERCVKDLLCALSGSTIDTLKGLITQYRAALATQITVLQTQLIKLDVLTLPQQLANELAQTAIQEVRSGADNIIANIPLADCLALSEVTEAIQTNIDVTLAEANAIVEDLNRLLSRRAEVEALIAALEEKRTLYLDVLTALDECGS